jgi:quercetin dioxygenase-like cupin family protein
MKIRRLVTGHDTQGRACVLKDDTVAGKDLAGGIASFAVLWTTVGQPIDNDDATDRSAVPGGLVQENGSILRIVETPAGSCSPMHRTNSLDYGIVLEGNVELELDDGRIVALSAGDVIVQRGTIHAWRNPGPSTNRMAFVLLSAKPATVPLAGSSGKRVPLGPVSHDIRPADPS